MIRGIGGLEGIGQVLGLKSGGILDRSPLNLRDPLARTTSSPR